MAANNANYTNNDNERRRIDDGNGVAWLVIVLFH